MSWYGWTSTWAGSGSSSDMSDMGDAAVGAGDACRGDDGGAGAVGDTEAGSGGDVGGESGTIRSSSRSDDSSAAHAAQCQSISMSSLTAAR